MGDRGRQGRANLDPRQNQGPHARILISTPTPHARIWHAKMFGKEIVARNAPRQNLQKPRKGYFSMWLHGACNYAAQSSHMGL